MPIVMPSCRFSHRCKKAVFLMIRHIGTGINEQQMFSVNNKSLTMWICAVAVLVVLAGNLLLLLNS